MYVIVDQADEGPPWYLLDRRPFIGMDLAAPVGSFVFNGDLPARPDLDRDEPWRWSREVLDATRFTEEDATAAALILHGDPEQVAGVLTIVPELEAMARARTNPWST